MIANIFLPADIFLQQNISPTNEMCSKIMANYSLLAKLCQNARQVIKNLADFKGTQGTPLLLAESIQHM